MSTTTLPMTAPSPAYPTASSPLHAHLAPNPNPKLFHRSSFNIHRSPSSPPHPIAPDLTPPVSSSPKPIPNVPTTPSPHLTPFWRASRRGATPSRGVRGAGRGRRASPKPPLTLPNIPPRFPKHAQHRKTHNRSINFGNHLRNHLPHSHFRVFTFSCFYVSPPPPTFFFHLRFHSKSLAAPPPSPTTDGLRAICGPPFLPLPFSPPQTQSPNAPVPHSRIASNHQPAPNGPPAPANF